MAEVTSSLIASQLTTRFRDQLADAINRAVVLATLLPVRNDRGQGKQVNFDAIFGTAKGAPIAEGATVTVFNNDDTVPATLNYADYHDAFKVTGKARATASAAGNPRDLEDIWSFNLDRSCQRLAAIINEHLYLGDSTASPGEFVGLVATSGVPVLADSGIYANIDRATYAQWRAWHRVATAFDAINNPTGSFSLLQSSQNAPDGIRMLHEMDRQIYEQSSKRSDLYVTSPILHEAYGLAVHRERRWVDEVRTTAQGTIKLDSGYMVLEFGGRPIVMDKDCPDTEFLGLYTPDLYIQQLPDRVDMVNQAMGQKMIEGSEDAFRGSGRTRLDARIQPLAVTGDSYPFSLFMYAQLVALRCNSQGRISALVP